MKRPEILSEDEIKKNLENLRNWVKKEDAIYARFGEFSTYRKAVDFLVEISFIAEKLDHHPEIRLGYNHIEVIASTHEPKGLTMLDFQLADGINKLLL
jgi:4a-hydroxytetrahydrobiopterin dehydratase